MGRQAPDFGHQSQRHIFACVFGVFVFVCCASVSQGAEINITYGAGEIVAATTENGCDISIDHYLKWKTLRYRNACAQTLERKVVLFERLLAALHRKEPLPAEISSLGFGRLIRFPELAERLALAAKKSPTWDENRGRARGRADHDVGSDHRVVIELAEQEALFEAFAPALQKAGFAAAGVDVEKVLVSKPTEMGFRNGLLAAGAAPNDRLPFDAMVWLKLRPKE